MHDLFWNRIWLAKIPPSPLALPTDRCRVVPVACAWFPSLRDCSPIAPSIWEWLINTWNRIWLPKIPLSSPPSPSLALLADRWPGARSMCLSCQTASSKLSQFTQKCSRIKPIPRPTQKHQKYLWSSLSLPTALWIYQLTTGLARWNDQRAESLR